MFGKLVPSTRRSFLAHGVAGLGVVLLGRELVGCSSDSAVSTAATGGGGGAGGQAQGGLPAAATTTGGAMPTQTNIPGLGPLRETPDANGLRLPEGFTSRVVAQTGKQPVAGSSYVWHTAPDGGATYPTEDGGWIYVSNSEVPLVGGVGALRFAPDGTLVDAYPILSGTNVNCAGGATPWNTWLSCEETSTGRVWECDPYGELEAIVRPALGVFKHEAVAVAPELGHLFLTEDESDGRFYRFRPARMVGDRPDLTEGTLEVARVVDGAVTWLALPDPQATEGPTRFQLADSTVFKGGEGIWYHDGKVYLTTKGDNRVWVYDTVAETIAVLYDAKAFDGEAILTGVDNVTVSPFGDVIVAEDGGDMQIVSVSNGKLVPLMQVVDHPTSEVCGPAFSPDLTRLYFSSQRGNGEGGITYEITGPFFT